MAEPKLCAKCGVNPAARNHRWCNPCKANAQREYDEVSERQTEAQAFVRGVNAMREKLAKDMERCPPGATLLAGEVRVWILRSNGPLLLIEEPANAPT